MVSEEDNGGEAEDVSLGTSVSLLTLKKNPILMVGHALSSLTLQATNFFI